MQIRTRNNTLTLIRIKYDPAIKRGRSICLGTLSKTAAEIPPDIDEKLTQKEREQLLPVLARYRMELELECQAEAALALAKTIQRAALWYERQRRTTDLAALAKTSRDAFSTLLAAMVKVGVGRTRNRARKSGM